MAAGLAAGALTYFAFDRLVETKIPGAGPALALGALLDGIPEQAVLGIGLGAGEPISVGLLAAIFVSNLPESIGASSDLSAPGMPRRTINLLWLAVAVVCTLSTVAGYAVADTTGGDFRAAINGFAAGALLVMLVDSMIPEATKKAGRPRRARHRPRLRGRRRAFVITRVSRRIDLTFPGLRVTMSACPCRATTRSASPGRWTSSRRRSLRTRCARTESSATSVPSASIRRRCSA